MVPCFSFRTLSAARGWNFRPWHLNFKSLFWKLLCWSWLQFWIRVIVSVPRIINCIQNYVKVLLYFCGIIFLWLIPRCCFDKWVFKSRELVVSSGTILSALQIPTKQHRLFWRWNECFCLIFAAPQNIVLTNELSQERACYVCLPPL